MKKKTQKTTQIVFIIVIAAFALSSLGGLFTLPQIQVPTPEELARKNYEDALKRIRCIDPEKTLVQDFFVQLDVSIRDELVTIPGNIGIEPDCRRELYTKDDSGAIHISSDRQKEFLLKDFFDITGSPFSSRQIFNLVTGASDIIIMTVNGKPNAEYENLVLREGQQIAIEFTAAVQLPPGAEAPESPQETPEPAPENAMNGPQQ